jgi:hypothetical protein
MMHTAGCREPITPIAFPIGLHVHWETENRVMWSDQERVSEEQELVYEVSWICELGVWRRFLRSRRKVQR